MENKIVNACAGSGKTYDLIQRMLLLLEHNPPGSIVAITFTKKAAAEIQRRLLAALAEKAAGGAAWAADKQRRILLAETAADKIHIHTFHSWFLYLLAAAGGGDGQNRQLVESELPLLQTAWRRWLASPDIAAHLPGIFAYTSPLKLRQLLFYTAGKINEWQLYQSQNNGAEIEPPPPNIAPNIAPVRKLLRQFAAAAPNAPATTLKAKTAAENFLADGADGWQAAFFTTTDTMRKVLLTSAEKRGGGVLQILQDLAAAYEQFLTEKEELETARFNKTIGAAAEIFLREFESVKAEENAFTFNDLEYAAARAAAKNNGEFLAGLNGQFRHLLIDEFQDNSPLQWRIVRLWLEWAKKHNAPPSVFIVGDKRQAIYRFRNGDARLLAAAADFLRGAYNAEEVNKTLCRRSAPPVINAVNGLFENLQSEWLADNESLPGAVEWHPPPPVAAPPPQLRLRNPLAEARPENPSAARRKNWANRIADNLQNLIGKVGVGKERRPCRPEDIFVLLPQLTHAAALGGVLQERGLPFSVRGGGVSFLHTLPCRDIIALLSALLSDNNSLSLAQSLKSPLFSFSEAEFAAVAENTNGGGEENKTLWQKLLAAQTPAAKTAAETLQRWRAWARRGVLPAHDLLAKIFTDGKVLEKYAASSPAAQRNAVLANLNALLDFALHNDGGRQPLPRQFLSACAAAAEAKNPPAAAPAGGVQLATIHSAKGLESAVVVVADTSFGKSHRGDKSQSVDLLIDWPPAAAAPAEMVFRPRRLRRARANIAAAEETLREAEFDNLLYVALTRAKQFLFVFAVDEHNNARAEKLAAFFAQNAKEENGIWRIGDALPAAIPAAAPPPDVTVTVDNTSPTAAVGEPRDPALQRGEEIHNFVALLLGGLNEEDAARQVLPKHPDAAAAAKKIIAAVRREIPLGEMEIFCEAEFIENGKLLRIDLLAVGAREAWVVDYKSGGDLARYQSQLAAYRATTAKHYPQKTVRAALVTPAGEWREVS